MDDQSPLANYSRQDRIEAKLFKRIFNTPDGKAVIESIKRDIGWDQSGPPKDMSRKHWIGQRSVVFGILHKISTGQQILDLEE